MAAIDYTVCLHSEVFVTTQGGNFPHFLLGHRRYLYGGHSKTIKPDKRKLALLFDNPNIGWRSFKRQLLTMRSHSDSKGIELKRPNDSIYSFPCPDCMCRANRTANRTNDSKSSSAAWSTQSLKSVSVTYDFVSMRCRWPHFWYDDCFIFSHLPIWWEGISATFGDQRILFDVSLFWLYIWIQFQGSEWHVLCKWC